MASPPPRSTRLSLHLSILLFFLATSLFFSLGKRWPPLPLATSRLSLHFSILLFLYLPLFFFLWVSDGSPSPLAAPGLAFTSPFSSFFYLPLFFFWVSDGFGINNKRRRAGVAPPTFLVVPD